MHSQTVLNLVRNMNDNLEWGLSDSDIQEFTRGVSAHIQQPADVSSLELVIENYYTYHGIVRSLSPANRNSGGDGLDEEWYLYIKKVSSKLYYHKPVPGQEVDDIVQSAWFRIIKGIHTYHYRCRFETWVYQVVVNTHLELLRNAARKPVTVMGDDDLEKAAGRQTMHQDPLHTTIHGEESRETVSLVKKCLHAIAGSRRKLRQWLMNHPEAVDQMTLHALAVVLGDATQHAFARRYNLPEPTVSRIFHDLIEILRDEMK